jgi:hypothetical protein
VWAVYVKKHAPTQLLPGGHFYMEKDRRKTRGKLNLSLKSRRSKNLQLETQTGNVVQVATLDRDQLISPSKLHYSPTRRQSELEEVKISQQKLTGIHSQRVRDDFGDRERTEARYKRSVKKFEEAVRSRQASEKYLKVPAFESSEGSSIATLQEQITEMLSTHCQKTCKENNVVAKGKALMEKMFTALSPLAKNLLKIANDATSGVCDRRSHHLLK